MHASGDHRLTEDNQSSPKVQIRQLTKRRRADRDPHQRQRDDEHRNRLIFDRLGAQFAAETPLACYLSREPEPGTLELVDALYRRRFPVLCPVLSPHPDGTARHEIAWAWYQGSDQLIPGLWGIPEPVGQTLGAETLADVELAIISGLGGGRDGSRIGTGGGWYDRALNAAGPIPVWMLLNDDEVYPQLPQETHDHRVDALITPTQVVEIDAG